ncbi:MAG: carboxypeptidase regulatory-like domain-containing protein [Bacteroidetes bacterium]|nr:carboxypeptidase regulatory-like domain-containing protein [Bacteroidota bacterium]
MINRSTKIIFALIFGINVYAGDVTGKVSFTGAAPKMPKLNMNADKSCKGMHTTRVSSEEVVINKNNTLKNVFIYVKEGAKPTAAPTVPVTLSQKGCQYVPHILGIQVGQPFIIKNDDPTLHNVHSLGKANVQFNVAQPIKGMKLNKKFDKPEVMVKFKCDVHSWMNAYVGVVNNSYFAVSKDDGSFTIKGLPAGSYTLEAWHEKFGTKQIKITVADKSVTANFNYAAK